MRQNYHIDYSVLHGRQNEMRLNATSDTEFTATRIRNAKGFVSHEIYLYQLDLSGDVDKKMHGTLPHKERDSGGSDRCIVATLMPFGTPVEIIERGL